MIISSAPTRRSFSRNGIHTCVADEIYFSQTQIMIITTFTDSRPIVQSGNWRNITSENNGSPSLVAAFSRLATSGYLFNGRVRDDYLTVVYGVQEHERLPYVLLGVFAEIAWGNHAFAFGHVMFTCVVEIRHTLRPSLRLPAEISRN